MTGFVLAVGLYLGLACCAWVHGATRTWTGSSGDGRWVTAANWSGNAVPGDQDDAVIPPGAAGTIEVDGIATVRSLKNGGTMHVAGAFAGNATLSVSSDSENSGLILIGSARGDRSGTLQSIGGARLVNTSAGRIETASEGGGTRHFIGTLVNQGVVNATAIRLQASGGVDVAGGRFEGAVEFLNCEVKVTASPAQPTDVLLYGNTGRLVSDNLPRVVLRLISEADYNAVLNVPSNTVNHGTIRLEALRNDRTTTLAVDPAAVLSNAADGVIDTGGLGGALQASGSISNSGIIRVDNGRTLRFLNAGENFIHSGGAILSEGAFILVGGRFDFLGGALQGVVFAENAQIHVGPAVNVPSELFVRGNLAALGGLASKAVTLHVLSDSDYHATLTTLPGAVNSGRIVLDSSRTDRTARLDATAGFTNAPSGIVEAVAGGGGAREMVGSFVNRGLVTASGAAAVTATGEWEVAGGRNEGAVNLLNAGIRVTQSPAEPNTLLLYGSNSRLLTDNLPKVTLRVLSDAGYNAVLLVAATATNRGVIQLDSSQGDRTTFLDIADGATLENAADGAVEVLLGGGGGREIRRRLANRGRIHVEPGIGVIHRNTGATMLQQAGAIESEGPYTLEGGRLEFSGGKASGAFTALNAELQISASATQPSTVFVLGGGSTLAGLRSPAVTLQLTTSADNNTTLKTLAGAVNDGRIVLGSLRGDRFSKVDATEGLLNSPSGVIQSIRQAGGDRNLVGSVKNQGIITAPADWFLTVWGGFEVAGGRNEGPVNLVNTVLSVTASPAEPTELRLYGDLLRLTSDNLPRVELRVSSSADFHSRLAIAAGTTNRGVLRLTSERGDRTTTLAAETAGGAVVNGTGGRIEFQPGSGGARVLAGTLVNEGTFEAGINVSIAQVGDTHRNRGSLKLDSSTVAFTGAALINEADGIIGGTGNLDVRNAPFTNAGTLAPGSSPGLLTISGNYQQSVGAVVEAEIGGKVPGTQHDRVVINSGAMTFNGGTLKVRLVNGFIPVVGDEISLFQSNLAGSGNFAAYEGLPVSAGISWEPVYAPTSLKLKAVAANNPSVAPAIVKAPDDVTVQLGGSATFNVTVTGTIPLTYQWYFNDQPINGATQPSYTVNPVKVGSAGGYRVKVTNGAGSAMSTPGLLNVAGELVFRWDGGGDGLNWGDPRNWNTDRLPTPGSRVIIDVAGTPVVRLSGADVAISSVDCAENFELIDARLQFDSGASSFRGSLRMQGGDFTVSGAGTSLALSGAATITASSLFALNGASVSCPGITQYAVGPGVGVNYYWRAQGSGSLLDFPNLVDMDGATGAFSAQNIEALGGAKVRLPKVVGLDGGFIRFNADSAGSRIELDGLTGVHGHEFNLSRTGEFIAPGLTSLFESSLNVSGASPFPTLKLVSVDRCTIRARDGAALAFPLVVEVDGGETYGSCSLEAVGAGSSLGFPNVTRFRGIRAAFSGMNVTADLGGSIDLSQATDLGEYGIRFNVTRSGTLDLFSVTEFKGSEYYLNEGGQLLAPGLVTLNRALIQVAGATSLFPSLGVQTLERVSLLALDGAVLAFPRVTRYDGGTEQGSVQLVARGAGAVLDLSSLTEFIGIRAPFSSVSATADLGGVMRFSKLRQIGEGSAYFSGSRAGQFEFPLLESIYGHEFHLGSGARLVAPLLTDLSNTIVEIAADASFPTAKIRRLVRSSVFAIQGAQVILPGVLSYDAGSAPGSYSLQTRDAGSRLEFPALTRLDGAKAAFYSVEASSYSGATLSFPVLPRVNVGYLRVRADGAGSLTELPQLGSVEGVTIEAYNGGRVLLPELAEANRSELTFVNAGELAIPILADVRQSRVYTDNSKVTLPALKDTAGSNFEAVRGGSFVLPPAADLRVTDIVAPPAGLGGQLVAVDWTVSNASPTAVTGQRRDRFALRRAGTPDVVLGDVEVDGTLAENASHKHSTTLILPAGLTGVWQFVVTVDAGGDFYEGANEANNTTVDDAPIGLSSPDLVVTQVKPASASAVLGSTLKVNWVVKNQGSAGAPSAWEDQILFSKSAAELGEAVELGRAASIRPLAPGETYTNELVVTPPLVGGIPAGNYFIVVRSDVRDRQFEANEANNSGSAGLAITLPPLPDLEVSDVHAPETAFPGESVVVSFRLRNAGVQAFGGPLTEAVWVDAEGAPGSAGNPLAEGVRTVSLAPGASTLVERSLVLPGDFPPGSAWRFRVTLDRDNLVVESREDNNTGAADAVTTVPAALSVFVPQVSIREDAVPPTLTARVTRNGDPSQAVLVSLASDRPGQLSVPATVLIAAGERSAPFPLTVHPDGVADADASVAMTASAPGHRPGGARVTVVNADVPTLTLRFEAATVNEGQVASAVVSRNARLDEAVVVTFDTDSPGQLLPPAPLTLPPGKASATVVFPAVEDDVIEPLQVYTARAGATGFAPTQATIGVVDNDLPAIEFTVEPGQVSEGSGAQAAVGTVRRTGSTRAPLRILLTSSLPGSATVPASVVIPAGEASTTFPVAVVDNAAVDGTRTVELTAVGSYTATTEPAGAAVRRNLVVTDNDGPSLTLQLDKHVAGEGLSPATGATVRRNSSVAAALVVQLASSDATEAVPPAQVTIPAGSAEVRFDVATISDATADGNQAVRLTAMAAGHLPGYDTLVVTDAAKPDLVVSQVTAPATGLTRALATIGWQVRNQGLAEAKGKFKQVVYLSRDAQLDADDPVIAEQELDGQLPPDVSFSFARSVFLPADPGTYWAIVRTDFGNAFDEVLEDNNVSVSASPIRVEAAYFAEIGTDVVTGRSGEPVVMRGVAYKSGTRTPAPFEIVSIHVTHDSVRRVIAALTEADGSFVGVFRPGLTEAGFYEVAAAHPRVDNPAVQDQFTLVGMLSDPRELVVSVVAGGAADGTLALKNLGPAELSGLTGEWLGLPAGLTGTVTPPASLPPQGSGTTAYHLAAGEGAAGSYAVTLRVASANGARSDTPVQVVVRPKVPQLEITPSPLVAGMVRGRQTLVELTVKNTGSAASGPLTLALPEVAWLSSASALPAGSIAPGESTALKLLLTPGEGLPLTQYTGEIGVVASGATARVPFAFRAVSEAIGDLDVVAEDEFTYYVAGEPRVADALVQVLDPFSSAVLREARTDAAGKVSFKGLAEGTYLLRVTSPKHARREVRVDIAVGVTRTERVLLPAESVTFNWTVVPTEIPDRYRFTVDSVFEANVPIPVLTSEPFLMPIVFPGEVTQTSITITNHGLIAAKKLQIRVRSTKRYLITPLFTEIGDLPAKSTITVPIFVQHQPDVDAAMLQRLEELGRNEPAGKPAPAMTLAGGMAPRTHILTPEERRQLEARGILPAARAATASGRHISLAGGPRLLDDAGGGGGGGDDCEQPELEFLYFIICGPDGSWHLISIDLRPLTLLKDLEGCIKAIAEGIGKGAAGIPGIVCDCASSAAVALGGSVPKELECLCAFLSLDAGGIAACLCPKIPPGEGFGGGGGGGAWSASGASYPSGDGLCTIGGLSGTASARRHAGLAGRRTDPLPVETEAGDGVCARVKLRLEQDLVLTRSAFRGTLEIDNRLAGVVSNLNFRIDFFDARGALANPLFGIHPPALRGLSAVDGTGVLLANTIGTAEYTLVPAVDAAPEGETPYTVGGELRYFAEGREVVVTLQPVPIKVLPQPRILVDYFHQRDVFSDDPHTEEVEPSEPYSLAVLLRNVGKGGAKQVSITSSQPKIIDNEKGLLVDFQVVATEVAGADGIRSLTPALTADFGDLPSGGVKVGRWLLKSSLQGLFIDYEAKFEHLDGLGQRNLSLIDPDHVLIHELSHIVTDFRAGADALPDFLVNGDYQTDTNDLPDTLYLSTGGIEPVSVVREATASGAPTAAALRVGLSAFLPQGWSYLRVTDPQGGTGLRRFNVVEVRRPDGTAVPRSNFWQTDRTFIGQGKRPIRENILHLLDFNSPDHYTLVYEESAPVDAVAPQSSVATLPPQVFDQFPLQWSGTDNSGAALKFDVLVSADGAPFAPWLRDTALTSALYPGERGHRYAFYSVAIDAAGNREAAPAAPDAVTSTSLVNTAPKLKPMVSFRVDEGSEVDVTATAADPDVPLQSLTYSLAPGGPSGLGIDAGTGRLRWQTGEGNGPSTNRVTLFVRDNGAPPLTDSVSFDVIVNEVNRPPAVPPLANATVKEGALLTFIVAATDEDLPANNLRYSLAAGAPQGAVIDPKSGVFTWRPREFQGPSTNKLTVLVTDDGVPAAATPREFTVVVRDAQSDFRLSIGSTNTPAGTGQSVPVRLVTGIPIISLEFQLDSPSTALTQLRLDPLAPEIDSVILQPQGAGRYGVTIFVTSGQSLDGELDLGRIGFDTSPATSEVAPLVPNALTATGLDGVTKLRGAGSGGRVFVVKDRPLLDAGIAPRATLYGLPGRTYRVEAAATVDGPDPWELIRQLKLSEPYADVVVPADGATRFLRAREVPAP